MSSVYRRMVLVGAVVATIGFGVPVQAHQTDESEHETEIDVEAGEVDQMLRVSAKDLAHHFGHIGHHEEPSEELLDEIESELRGYFEEHTGVRVDGEMCEMTVSQFEHYPGGDGRVHYRQVWDCPAHPREVEFANRIMLDGHEGYRHNAEIVVDGEVHPTVFDPQYPTYAVYPDSQTDEAGDESETQPGAEVSDSDRGGESEAGDDNDGLPLWVMIGIIALIGIGVAVGWRRYRDS